jgi:hypothetical protein
MRQPNPAGTRDDAEAFDDSRAHWNCRREYPCQRASFTTSSRTDIGAGWCSSLKSGMTLAIDITAARPTPQLTFPEVQHDAD